MLKYTLRKFNNKPQFLIIRSELRRIRCQGTQGGFRLRLQLRHDGRGDGLPDRLDPSPGVRDRLGERRPGSQHLRRRPLQQQHEEGFRGRHAHERAASFALPGLFRLHRVPRVCE